MTVPPRARTIFLENVLMMHRTACDCNFPEAVTNALAETALQASNFCREAHFGKIEVAMRSEEFEAMVKRGIVPLPSNVFQKPETANNMTECYFEFSVESGEISDGEYKTAKEAREAASEEWVRLCDDGDYEYGRGDATIYCFDCNGVEMMRGDYRVFSDRAEPNESPYLQKEFI